MRRTQLLQELRKMKFEEAYEGWQRGRLTQEEAARLLGVCERSFRRYIRRYEEEGLAGLIDKRLEQVSRLVCYTVAIGGVFGLSAEACCMLGLFP